MRHHPSPTAAFRYRVGLGRSSDGNDDATGDQDHNHAIRAGRIRPGADHAAQNRWTSADFASRWIGKRKPRNATYEAAQKAGLGIKKEHPILQVAVNDGVKGVSKIIELP